MTTTNNNTTTATNNNSNVKENTMRNVMVMIDNGEVKVAKNIYGLKDYTLHFVSIIGERVCVMNCSYKGVKDTMPVPTAENLLINYKAKLIKVGKTTLRAWNYRVVAKRNNPETRIEELYLDVRDGLLIKDNKAEKQFKPYDFKWKAPKNFIVVPDPTHRLTDVKDISNRLGREFNIHCVDSRVLLGKAYNDSEYDITKFVGFPGARSNKTYNQMLDRTDKVNLVSQKAMTYIADMLDHRSPHTFIGKADRLVLTYHAPLEYASDTKNKYANPELPKELYSVVNNFNKYNAWKGQEIGIYNTAIGVYTDLTNMSAGQIRDALIQQYVTFDYAQNKRDLEKYDEITINTVRELGLAPITETVMAVSYDGYTNITGREDILASDVEKALKDIDVLDAIDKYREDAKSLIRHKNGLVDLIAELELRAEELQADLQFLAIAKDYTKNQIAGTRDFRNLLQIQESIVEMTIELHNIAPEYSLDRVAELNQLVVAPTYDDEELEARAEEDNFKTIDVTEFVTVR